MSELRPPAPLTPAELTGRARSHVVDVDVPPCTLHRDVVAPLQAMRAAAAADGIDLVPVSSFRDFARQAAIWNAKFRGERMLLDRDGCELDGRCLDPAQRVEAILLWSALPGASRHHWGTDFDVIDAAAVPADYRVQLVPAEFAADGVFARLDRWLAEHMERFGFFRPYAQDRGGVQPEPWHLSFAPVATQALRALTPAVLRAALEDEASGVVIEGREIVIAQVDALHERYVARVDGPRPDQSSVQTLRI